MPNKDKISKKRKPTADSANETKQNKRQGTVTERSHLENQERAYIAASRRKDRPIEARLESAYKASECHKRIHGRGLWITREIVENDLFYDEHDPRFERMKSSAGMQNNSMAMGPPQSPSVYTSTLLDSLHMHHTQAKARPSPPPSGWNAYSPSMANRSPITLQHPRSREFSVPSPVTQPPSPMYQTHMRQQSASPAPSMMSVSYDQSNESEPQKTSAELFQMVQQAQAQKRQHQIFHQQLQQASRLEHFPTQWSTNNFTGVMSPTYTNPPANLFSITGKKVKSELNNYDSTLATASQQDITRNFKIDVSSANMLGRVPEIKTPPGMPSISRRWDAPMPQQKSSDANQPQFYTSPEHSQADYTRSMARSAKMTPYDYDLFQEYQNTNTSEQHTNNTFNDSIHNNTDSTPLPLNTPMDEASTMFPMAAGDAWEWMVNFDGSQSAPFG